MESVVLVDAAGRRRSPATLPEFHAGRPPRTKGLRYPAEPPPVEEIVAVMREAGHSRHGLRMRGLLAVLWRSGLRISEALALNESDLDRERGAILVRCGKGGKRRDVGMDLWGWEQLAAWLDERVQLPVGALFCQSPSPPRGTRGPARRCEPSYVDTPCRPGCAGGSPRTSCATPTPLRWPARACP